MTVTLELNMRLISLLSSNMFRRRITIHGQFLLYKQGTSYKNQPALGSGHCACHLIMDIVIVYPAHYRTTVGQWLDTLVPRRCIGMGVQLHRKRGVQNLTLVDFYMKSLAEHRNSSPKHSDEIRRIFSPRVNVIEIRKCVRACIRRREDHFEQNFAN
ncbi:hypothetical protein SFRURICE_017521 [Spodoptera frugiperda]|nr:hypothetical protein SFRURICE_017521 [Spodoptera frugiperda]